MIPLLLVYVLVVTIAFTTGWYIGVAIDRRRDCPDTDLAAEWDDLAPEDVTEAIAAVPADWDVAAEPEPVTGRVWSAEAELVADLERDGWFDPGFQAHLYAQHYAEPPRAPDDTDRLASTGEMWLFRAYLDADDARDRLCSAERASEALAESRRILAGA
jgi:hypothetical protein